MTKLLDTLPEIGGSYREGADLSKTNWFNVGGRAEVLFRPADTEDLSYFIKHKPDNVPLTILGVGSNLLVRDGGIDGVVIKLGRGFTDIRKEGDTIHAGAGALSYNVSMMAAQSGVAGLEFLSGIPGAIGGALAMNAGAYGSDTASVLVRAELVDEAGDIHWLSVEDIGYIYRGNTLPEGMIFTKAVFQGHYDKVDAITARIDDIQHKRHSSQPVKERTSGSTFKNPQGHRAWELIDQAGCRGLQIGGAQVSKKHCNFFINTGNATAHDIEALGEEVRRRVKECSGVELQWEVQMIGKE
jgi:UDP-N-acetylmuramate dehydrogenase